MGFLVRLIPAVVLVICLFIIAYALVLIANRGIQFFLRYFGYEIKDFGSFVRSMLPKRKKRKHAKKPSATPPAPPPVD